MKSSEANRNVRFKKEIKDQKLLSRNSWRKSSELPDNWFIFGREQFQQTDNDHDQNYQVYTIEVNF